MHARRLLFHTVFWALLLFSGLPLYYLYVDAIPLLGELHSDEGTAAVTGSRKTTFLGLVRPDGRTLEFSCRSHPMSRSWCLPVSVNGQSITVQWYWARSYPFLAVRRPMRITSGAQELKSYDSSVNGLRSSRAIYATIEALLLLLWLLGWWKMPKD